MAGLTHNFYEEHLRIGDMPKPKSETIHWNYNFRTLKVLFIRFEKAKRRYLMY